MAQIELLCGERQKGESRQAVIACNDYLRMGVGRSLRQLHAQYCKEVQRTAIPTRGFRTLGGWSSQFAWQARAELYDAAIDAEKTARLTEQRRQVMEEGAALDYIRAGKLKKLAEFLEDQLYQTEPMGPKIQDLQKAKDVEARVAEAEIKDGARPPWMKHEPDEDLGEFADEPAGERYKNIWLRDYKGVGGVAYEVERFNAPLIEQYRGTLDDLAKEKGERKLRVESSSLAVQLTAEDLASAQDALQRWEKARFGVNNVPSKGSTDASDA